jgi:hypothetical protein
MDLRNLCANVLATCPALESTHNFLLAFASSARVFASSGLSFIRPLMGLRNSSSSDEDSKPLRSSIKPIQVPIAMNETCGKRAPSEVPSYGQGPSNVGHLLEKRCSSSHAKTPPSKKQKVQQCHRAEHKPAHQKSRQRNHGCSLVSDGIQPSTLFSTPNRQHEVQPPASPASPASLGSPASPTKSKKSCYSNDEECAETGF